MRVCARRSGGPLASCTCRSRGERREAGEEDREEDDEAPSKLKLNPPLFVAFIF